MGGLSLLLRLDVTALLLCALVAIAPGRALAEAPTLRADPQHAWPGDQRSLVFVWENASASNDVFDADGNRVRSCQVKPQGAAKFDKHGAMDLAAGSFVAEEIEKALAEACRDSDAFTIELTVTPHNLLQEGRIMTCVPDKSLPKRERVSNLFVRQRRDRLVAGYRALGSESLCEVNLPKVGGPVHFVLTMGGSLQAAYVNGKPANVGENTPPPRLSNWAPQPLVFGGADEGKSLWKGAVEAVAVYSTALPPKEVAEHYRLRQEQLKDR